MKLALLFSLCLSVSSAINTFHYGDPADGCMADESSVDPGGIYQSAVCAKACSSTADCPTDLPPGSTAVPMCANQLCVLNCGVSPPKCPGGKRGGVWGHREGRETVSHGDCVFELWG